MAISNYAADSDDKNIERVTFRPYDAVVPNKDAHDKEYPVSFGRADINDDGYIRYSVSGGSCNIGLAFCLLDSQLFCVREEELK